MDVDGKRTQVYRLVEEHGGWALSGTAEMAFGAMLTSKTIGPEHRKMCAVSR